MHKTMKEGLKRSSAKRGKLHKRTASPMGRKLKRDYVQFKAPQDYA